VFAIARDLRGPVIPIRTSGVLDLGYLCLGLRAMAMAEDIEEPRTTEEGERL
jgi:hypothetical protein